jgi:REP-associated tyrosine transposase
MFVDDWDRTAFCMRLASAIKKYALVCEAFVLMPTHFHLLMSVVDDVLSPAVRDAFGPYAQEFNKRWSRSGHLRGDPFKLRLVADEADFVGVVKYIARNPVKAGLCEKPQDWYWSSYRGSAGYAEQFPFVDDRRVLGVFHDDRARAIWFLRLFVENP